jgi:hypothetical protein
MFYPVMLTTFLDLANGLVKDGHNDLALNALHKYDAVMPDITPGFEVADRKLLMGKMAYDLHDIILGNKLMTSVDDYVTDQLDYNYYQMKDNSSAFNPQAVQNCMYFVNGLVEITGENHQTALNDKYKAQLNDYKNKFSAALQGSGR